MPPPFNINENSPAASSLISSYPADEQSNRAEIEEWLSYISDPATGMIRESVLPPSSDSAIPTGSKMLFIQTAAPTGWTKDITHNNKALRLVNGTAGTGGTANFTDVFTSRTPTGTNASVAVTGTTDATTQGGTIGNTTSTGTVGGTAITLAQMAPHGHNVSVFGVTDAQGSHSHTVPTSGSVGSSSASAVSGVGAVTNNTTTSVAGSHQHNVSSTGSADVQGSGQTHTHSLTMNAHNHTFTGNSHTHSFTAATHTHTFTGAAMDFAVAYVDAIIATKD